MVIRLQIRMAEHTRMRDEEASKAYAREMGALNASIKKTPQIIICPDKAA